jgi:hypothetical protein
MAAMRFKTLDTAPRSKVQDLPLVASFLSWLAPNLRSLGDEHMPGEKWYQVERLLSANEGSRASVDSDEDESDF